jgi:transcriptional regulator with XRE-family HTH domain
MSGSPSRINVRALYAALDAQRAGAGLSWRQLAKERGLSPSTFTRLANGHRPDVDAFVALVRWLGQPAEHFMAREPHDSLEAEPTLIAQLAPLLRARKDLDEDEAAHLQGLFEAAIEKYRAERSSG